MSAMPFVLHMRRPPLIVCFGSLTCLLLSGCILLRLEYALALAGVTDPGVNSGDLLLAFPHAVVQIDSPVRLDSTYRTFVIGRNVVEGFQEESAEGNFLGGLAFADTADGLCLYLATRFGLQVYDGWRWRTRLDTIPVADCDDMGDVVVLQDGSVIASCPKAGALVRFDPATRTVVDSFSCCEGFDGAFTPRALALSVDGRLLAGTQRVEMFDCETGEHLGVAISGGILGATSYDDYVFGPNGNLFVSANPDIGVLEFNGLSFEFLEVFVTGGEGYPGALAFDQNGDLFVGRRTTAITRKFDGRTGELLLQLTNIYFTESSFSFMAVRP